MQRNYELKQITSKQENARIIDKNRKKNIPKNWCSWD